MWAQGPGCVGHVGSPGAGEHCGPAGVPPGAACFLGGKPCAAVGGVAVPPGGRLVILTGAALSLARARRSAGPCASLSVFESSCQVRGRRALLPTRPCGLWSAESLKGMEPCHLAAGTVGLRAVPAPGKTSPWGVRGTPAPGVGGVLSPCPPVQQALPPDPGRPGPRVWDLYSVCELFCALYFTGPRPDSC